MMPEIWEVGAYFIHLKFKFSEKATKDEISNLDLSFTGKHQIKDGESIFFVAFSENMNFIYFMLMW